MNRGLKRRSRVVQVFPSERSLLRLTGRGDVRAGRGVVDVALLLGGEDARALRREGAGDEQDGAEPRRPRGEGEEDDRLEPRACGQGRGDLRWQMDSGLMAVAASRRSERYTNFPDTTVVFLLKAKTLRSERLHQQLAHGRSIKPYSLPEGYQINGP